MALKITFEARTDVGRERDENQDHFGSARFDNAEFFIVCDGMGGHAGGSTASRLGVQAMERTLQETHAPANDDAAADAAAEVEDDAPAVDATEADATEAAASDAQADADETRANDSEDTVPARIEAAVHHANDAIFAMAQERRELRGMGTTAVVLGIDHAEERAYVVHVGDSRIYRLRDHVFQRLTRDHTMVQRLVDEGIISEEDAEHHPNSNVISRSLGGHPTVEVEHGPEAFDLQDGDIFLLCSDGLSGLVHEIAMAEVLAHYEPGEAAEHLIDMANAAGGYDNITVEIILVGEKKPPFTHDVELIHPPKGPSVRELRERELAESMGAYEERFNDPPPIEIPEPVKAPAEDKTHRHAAPVVEKANNHRLLAVLGSLVVVLIVLVASLIFRMQPVEGGEVVEVPTTETLPEDDELVLPFEDPEDLVPVPAVEVPEEELLEEEQADANDDAP